MKSSLKVVLLFNVLIFIISCGTQKDSDLNVQEILFPYSESAILPHLIASDDKIYLSWVDTISDSTSQLKFAKFENNKWTKESVLYKGMNWFINWADYPMIGINNGKIVSSFLQNSGSKGMAYDIYFNVSDINDLNNNIYQKLNTDQTNTEHGFVSILPKNNNEFLLVWLDGRNMANHDHHSGHSHDHHSGEMNVRTADIDFNGKITNESVVDQMACTCCQTTASMTSTGPVILYRDCSVDNIRDIAIVRQVNGKWTNPKVIHNDNWFIEGCPVNGPKSTAIGNSLAVAWYTAADDRAKVQVVFSENGGETFGNPILISDKNVLGRVDVSMLNKEEIIVSWMETTGNETFLYVTRVNNKGKVSKPIKVAKLSSSRKTGFPQMEIVREKVYFTWMDINEKKNNLRVAELSLKKE